MPTTLPLHEALNESIPSGRFEDTKVILYSQRDTSGNVYGPRALYAASRVLKTVPYFNDRESPMHACPSDRAVDNALQVLSGSFAEAGLKDFSEDIDDGEIAEDYSYYSDSDLEDDNHFVDSTEPSEGVAPLTKLSLNPCSSSLGNDRSPHAYDERRKLPRQGKLTKIRDVAFITYVFSKNYAAVLLRT